MRSLAVALAAVLTLAVVTVLVTDVTADSHKDKDLVGVAAGSPDHKTLVKLVKAAGLVEALQGPGPLTVFAPTDKAFAKLPQSTLDALSKPENKEKLKAILLYHVVNGKVTAKDVMAMKSPTSVETLNGAKIKITHDKTTVRVNNARVTKADLMASNGVIHVIDTVLLPPEKK